jgi:hypothetical protein
MAQNLTHPLSYFTILIFSTLFLPPSVSQAQNADLAMAKLPKASSNAAKKAEATVQAEQQFLKFEQNVGQFPESNLLFKAIDAQATYFFLKNEVRSVVASAKDSMQLAYALQFVGANEGVDIRGVGKSHSKHGATNYITAAGSYSDVSRHNQLQYNNLWNGVNAHFYESKEGSGTMKYDFIVQPNADPSVVKLKMGGVTDLKINKKGELEFTTPFGVLQKGKPFTYQTIGGKQVEVASEYVLDDNGDISFKLGNYDPALPLVIDPIALKWSTYLMAGTQFVYDIYVHPTTGRIYLVGNTNNTTFPNTLGRTFGGPGDAATKGDAFVTCMEKDGTTLVWSTFLGGSGSEIAYAVSVDAASDVYVAGRTESTNFPVNGTTTAYDATFNGTTDIFIVRLNSTGATLKYSTFIGGSSGDGSTSSNFRKLVLDNGKVYVGSSSSSTNFPTTSGAHQTSKSGTNPVGVLLCLNTNVEGAAGLEMSTYFNGLQGTNSSIPSTFNEIEEDKDGNLWLVGNTRFDPLFPVSANAVQKYADFNYTGTTEANFVAKFSKSGQHLYSSWVHPLWSPTTTSYSWSTQYVPSLDVDAAGNVYVAAATYLSATTPATVKKAPNILAYHELSPLSTMINSSDLQLGYLAKIPYDLSPQYDFVSVFPSDAANNFADPEVAVDKKGNIHLFTNGDSDAYLPLTAGAANTNTAGPFRSPSVYYVLPPSGSSVLYGTVLNSRFSYAYYGMFVNDNCEAYIISESEGVGNNYPITPSYRDFETNTQKTVYNSTVNSGWALSVFHEPTPNGNTIPNFAVGNNTFCVDGAIWQNPNDGPILGSTPTYTSGNGSSATHNLPNISYNGATSVAHPTPASPALAYQWQKRVNGGAWTNVGNGTYAVYKPSPEPAAGTVEYRRLVQGALCCDSASVSNVASATISGTFNLNIATPSKPVYYCPTVAGTSLGITITGASGNISWQWYDGYAPLSGTGIISPSSGSGVAQGSFTANVGTSVTGSGFYRLIVTDAGGCRREAFVAIAPKTADAGTASSVALCPGGSISVVLGPPSVNPDFSYSWTGPGGFTSTSPNPTVTTAGTYTLQVKLTADLSFCSPGTTVTVTASTAHDVALVNIPNKGFCQAGDPASIGLSGTQPSGYVFQWVPGTNLDNQQAYNPIFDPGNLPGGGAVGTVNYTFSALRLSDGCIFEDQVTVTDTARALAQAGIDKPACGTDPSSVHGAPETTGSFYEWRAVGTTYPGGLAALTSHPKFKMNGVASNLATTKFLTAHFPDHTACYTIDYEIISSYVPITAGGCFTRDTARLFYCPTCGGDWCSDLTSNATGTNGACSGAENWIGGESLGGLTYTWETHSVNGVVQSGSNREPRGLYTLNADGTKGAAFSAAGPHPSKAIADFDNAVWGWLGANVVIYRLKANGNFGEGVIDCHRDIQVFSADDAVPAIGVIDQSLCFIASPGIRLGTTGQAAPYTLDGTDYTQAPNSAFIWTWTNVDGTVASTITSGATTRFPTFNPSVTSQYLVVARDPATGCFAKDTLTVKVKSVIANAGFNLSNICPGSLVQLGTAAQDGYSYSWSPSAGLNFPIGTPNSMTAQPYLTVPSVPAAPATLTYTVTVTDSETGCQATDDLTIGTTTTAPPALTAAAYNACPSSSFTIGPSGSLTGATYQWTVVSGGNLSWLGSTTVRQPIISLPAGFTGPAVFRLTMTKGTCGSVFADYTINNSNPTITLTGGTADCTTGLAIGETALSGYTYRWSPFTGLYTNNTLATAYTGTSLSTVYARPTVTTIYTVTRTHNITGCQQTATVTVNPPTGVAVNAGADKSYCIGGSSITIGSTGSGTLSWTAIGYTDDPFDVTPTAIAAPMTGATMLGYIGGSANSATRSFATGTPSVGKYVYRVTSTSGTCNITDDVVVTVPSLPSGLAGVSKNVCPGESVQLGSSTAPSTGSYAWSAINPSTENGTIDVPSAKRPTVTPSVNTTYQVIFTDGGSGCSVTEEVPVVVNPKPNAADVSMPIACAPISAVNLTSQVSGYGSLVNPVWYQNFYPGGAVVSTPTSVTPTSTTDYFLVSENTYGCKDTAQITVNVANPQTPNIAPSVNVPCSTTSLNLADYQGSPSQVGYTLEWHNANNTTAGSLLASTVITTAGTYYLFEKAPSPSNCYSASDNIVVMFLTPNTPSVTTPQTNSCPTTTVNLNTVATSLTPSVSGGVFEWRTTNSSTSPLVSTPTAVTAGTYYLFEKAPNGCYSAAFSVQVQIQNCCPTPACIPVTIVRMTGN